MAAWLRAVLPFLRASAAAGPDLTGVIDGERVVYARIRDVIDISDDESPRLRRRVSPDRLKWLLTSESLIFAGETTIRPPQGGRSVRHLAFRISRIAAFVRAHV